MERKGKSVDDGKKDLSKEEDERRLESQGRGRYNQSETI
jgi:hypothetical protein